MYMTFVVQHTCITLLQFKNLNFTIFRKKPLHVGIEAEKPSSYKQSTLNLFHYTIKYVEQTDRKTLLVSTSSFLVPGEGSIYPQQQHSSKTLPCIVSVPFFTSIPHAKVFYTKTLTLQFRSFFVFADVKSSAFRSFLRFILQLCFLQAKMILYTMHVLK